MIGSHRAARLSRAGFSALALFAAQLAASAHAADAPPAPPPLAVYGALPGVEDMAIAPDGKKIASVAMVDGKRRLIVLDGEDKMRVAAAIDDVKVGGIEWAGNDHVTIRLRSTVHMPPEYRSHMYEMWRPTYVAADGSKMVPLFNNMDNFMQASFGEYGVRPQGAHTYAYVAGIEAKRIGGGTDWHVENWHPALYAIDIATGSPHRVAIAPDGDISREWLVNDKGQVTATLSFFDRDGTWRLDGPNGHQIASGVASTGHIGLLAYTQDGQGVVLQDRDGDSTSRWMAVPLAGGEPKIVVAGIGVRHAFIDPLTSRLLGYQPKADDSAPVMFDPAQQAIMARVARAFTGRHPQVEDFTPDLARVVVRTSGNGDPGTWYRVDVAGKKADPVGYDRPSLPDDAVGAVSVVPYKAADGLEMDGILTLPPGRTAKNLPAIMLPHGGPASYDRAEFDWWAQALASRGYAVFQPNFRGSTNRSDAFRDAGNGQWGRAMQTDISDGLAELVKQGIVDPKRVCIVGASYGGYAALAGVTLQKGLYRCAVAVAGVSDLDEMVVQDMFRSGYDPTLRRELLESLGPRKDFAAVSPRRHAADADAPVLLIHGQEDTVVPFHQSTAMLSALQKAGKSAEMVTLSAEDHWLSHSATRTQMLEASTAFVLKHNPPD